MEHQTISPVESHGRPTHSDVEELRKVIGSCVANKISSGRQQTFSSLTPNSSQIKLPATTGAAGFVPASPMTPPADSPSDLGSEIDVDDDHRADLNSDTSVASASRILSTATHVLATEARALEALSRLYETDEICRQGFLRAVEAIADSQERGGKTIVIGVGKSGKIGDKLVASMNSLGLLTTFLNPVDALHGDLGIIRKNDVLLLITYSGKTPELLQLLPHLPETLPLIALTAHLAYHTSPLTADRPSAILLPAPIPESEVSTFGVAAPTTSTTVAMAIGDALSLSVAERIHPSPKEVFKVNHPGGAIGQTNSAATKLSSPDLKKMKDVIVRFEDMPLVETPAFETGAETPMSLTNSSSGCSSGDNDSDADMIEWTPSPPAGSCLKGVTVLDCLRQAVRSSNGYLLSPDGSVVPPKKLLNCAEVMANVADANLGLVFDCERLVRVNSEASLVDVASKLRSHGLGQGDVVAIQESGKVVGCVEVEVVLDEARKLL